MRHLRQIGDDCFAVNVFAERQRNSAPRFRFLPIGRFEQLAQCDGDFARVGELDANRVFPRDGRENVNPLCARGSRQIALETHDLVHPNTFGRVNFVARDCRAFGNVARCDRNSKLRQRVDQRLLNALQFRRVGAAASFRIVLREQIESRQRVRFRVPRTTG